MANRGPVVLAVTAAMLASSTLFVALRFVSRVFVVHRVKLDDWFILLAWIIAFGLSFSICFATKFGLGRHESSISVSEQETLERLEYTFSVLYNPALMATKTSIGIFYLTLSKNQNIFRWATISTMVIVNVAGLALSLLNIFQCRPLTAMFENPRPENAHCTDIITLYLSSAPVNILTDLILLLLPMPLLKGMRLPRKQKIILYITFGFGAFVTAVDIVRISYLQQATTNRLRSVQSSGNDHASSDAQNTTDFSWYASISFMWTAVEVNVGIMCASVPHLKPLVARFMPQMLKPPSQTTAPRLQGEATLNSSDMRIAHRIPSIGNNPLPRAVPAQKDHHGGNNSGREDEEEMGFEEFINSAPGMDEMPQMQRSQTQNVSTIAYQQGTNFLDFMDMTEQKSIVYMTNRESIKPIAHVTFLFFLWGFAYGLLNTLNTRFQLIANMSPSQTMAQHGMYFAGYFVGPLTFGRLILKHWGFKACYIVGLVIYGTGALVFWPAAVLTSFAAFLISNFIVGLGLSTLEIAANPFIALCGPPRYAEMRLNFSQGIQAIGTVVSPLLAQKALFQDVLDAPSLIDVQWTYLAICLFTFILAYVYYLIDLPEVTDAELEASTRSVYRGRLDDLRKNRTISLTLGLAVLAQFFYVGSQEANGTAMASYLADVWPRANVSNFLAIGHSLFAISRFLAAFLGFFFKPRYLLLFFLSGTIIFAALTMSFGGSTGGGMLLMIYFFEGPIFSFIFAIPLRGLGKNTRNGAAFITAAISGGAVFDPIQHAVAVGHGWKYSYCVTVAAFAAATVFALYLNIHPDAREQTDPPSKDGLKLPLPAFRGSDEATVASREKSSEAAACSPASGGVAEIRDVGGLALR